MLEVNEQTKKLTQAETGIQSLSRPYCAACYTKRNGALLTPNNLLLKCKKIKYVQTPWKQTWPHGRTLLKVQPSRRAESSLVFLSSAVI